MTTVAAILKHKGYQVTTVSPTMPIEGVVGVLAEQRIGAVLIVDSTAQLLGIVSERDVVRCLAANGARTLEMTAGQLMTRALQVATPDRKRFHELFLLCGATVPGSKMYDRMEPKEVPCAQACCLKEPRLHGECLLAEDCQAELPMNYRAAAFCDFSGFSMCFEASKASR